MRSILSRAAVLIAVVLAVGLLAGCAATVRGEGRGARPPTLHPAALAALLETPPAGAHAWTSAWGLNATPTVRQFAADLYHPKYRRQVIADLRAEGLTAIAHRAWNAADTNGIDLILLAFASRKGAEDRFYTDTSEITERLDIRSFDMDGVPLDRVRGFIENGRDSDGDVRARVYACLPGSRIVLEAFSFSTRRFDKADIVRWTKAQLRQLR